MRAWIFALSITLGAHTLSAAPMDHVIKGAVIIDTKTGHILMDRLGQVSLQPASTLKLITTAAALHILGPETCFYTVLEYDGLLDKTGVLHGNVYIRGGGDPCLGSGRAQGSLPWNQQLAVWGQALQQAGILSIEGCIIGDDSAWTGPLRAVPSWLIEDVGNAYGAAPCALAFCENSYTLQLNPGTRIGERVDIIHIEPPIPSLKPTSSVTRGPANSGDGTCIYGSERDPQQIMLGTIPAQNSSFTVRGAIHHPEEVVATLFETHLKNQGILILNQSLPRLAHRTHLHTTTSPPVKEIVYWTNQKSINLYAEHLLRHIGKGSADRGILAVRAFLTSFGMNTEGFHMVDGSGLSYKNCITAHLLATFLFKMRTSPYFDLFLASLPVKEPHIRGKAGFISLVCNYAGYTTDQTFAILINNCPNQKIAQRAVAEFLLQLTSHPLDTAETPMIQTEAH